MCDKTGKVFVFNTRYRPHCGIVICHRCSLEQRCHLANKDEDINRWRNSTVSTMQESLCVCTYKIILLIQLFTERNVSFCEYVFLHQCIRWGDKTKYIKRAKKHLNNAAVLTIRIRHKFNRQLWLFAPSCSSGIKNSLYKKWLKTKSKISEDRYKNYRKVYKKNCTWGWIKLL